MTRAILALCLLPALGCQVTNITVHTDTPPGRVAEVLDDEMRLSTAVAVAVECTYTDFDSYYELPCQDLEVVLDEEGLAEVNAGFLEVDPDGYRRNDASGLDRAVVVLVGRAAGTTGIEFRHAHDSQRFELSVLAPE